MKWSGNGLQKLELAGKLECQLTMETIIKGEVILASRTRDISVTVRNEDPEVVVDVDMDKLQVIIKDQLWKDISFAKYLECRGIGHPAPYLSWWSVDDEDGLEELNEDVVQTLPLEVDYENGLQISRERLYLLNYEQMLACLVENRIGKREVKESSCSWLTA